MYIRTYFISRHFCSCVVSEELGGDAGAAVPIILLDNAAGEDSPVYETAMQFWDDLGGKGQVLNGGSIIRIGEFRYHLLINFLVRGEL